MRWSTLYQKVATAYLSMTRSESRDWKHVATRLLDLYGLGERSIVDRWIRAAKGMHPKVRDALKQYPDLKGAYLWDNTYLIQSPTHARLVLPPYYAVNALRILAERMAIEIEPFSAKRFEDDVCKPIEIVERWEALMKQRYGHVARESLALERLAGSLMAWSWLQAVIRCSYSGFDLHEVSCDGPCIMECHMLKNLFVKAYGLPPTQQTPLRGENLPPGEGRE